MSTRAAQPAPEREVCGPGHRGTTPPPVVARPPTPADAPCVRATVTARPQPGSRPHGALRALTSTAHPSGHTTSGPPATRLTPAPIPVHTALPPARGHAPMCAETPYAGGPYTAPGVSNSLRSWPTACGKLGQIISFAVPRLPTMDPETTRRPSSYHPPPCTARVASVARRSATEKSKPMFSKDLDSRSTPMGRPCYA